MEQPPPAAGTPSVPWSAAEICLAALIVLFFWPIVAFEALDAVGLFRHIYGPDVSALVQADEAGREQQRLALGLAAGPGAAEVGLPLLRRQILTRLNLWTELFGFPLQAATIPVLLYAVSRTRPGQLGLTTRRLGRNLLLGVAVFVVLTPPVLGLNYLVEFLYRSALGAEPRLHPFTQLAAGGMSSAEWALLVLSATVFHPVLEELTFRGMVQPWAATRPWGGQVTLAAAFVLALYSCKERVLAAVPLGLSPALLEASPALFVLALVPVYGLVVWRSRTPAAPAVFATAALFAAVHSSVWPSPVALFVLAVGLGTQALRTGSLAGPIVLHALFNGTACVQLLWTS
jgi:hypothetical protein